MKRKRRISILKREARRVSKPQKNLFKKCLKMTNRSKINTMNLLQKMKLHTKETRKSVKIMNNRITILKKLRMMMKIQMTISNSARDQFQFISSLTKMMASVYNLHQSMNTSTSKKSSKDNCNLWWTNFQISLRSVMAM